MVTIYGLTCITNEKVYVGCTKAKPAKRMREHRCLLNSGKHSEKELLSDWQELGQGAFKMVTLETFLWDFSLETRRAAELKWMNYFKDRGLLYNRNMTSFQPKPEAIAKGIQAAAKVNAVRVHSPESRLKRRLAQLGKPKNHGHKISATKQAKKLMR